MKKILFASLIAISAQAESAIAFITGNQFVGLTDIERRAYVTAVSDSIHYWDDKNYCTPKQITIGQISRIADKYMDDKPQERHLTAVSLIAASLQQAFPCK